MELALDGKRVELAKFMETVSSESPTLKISKEFEDRIASDHEIVLTHAKSNVPIYGLNTGLGANLGHRLKPTQVQEFQRQIIRGRAFAVGEPLCGNLVRGSLLARIVSARGSGMSPELFKKLAKWFESGAVPTVPSHGSIGASDLIQNAHLALCIIGEGTVEGPNGPIPTKEFLSQNEMVAHDPRPKDAMALINHSGLTLSVTAHALSEAIRCLRSARSAALLSVVGYQANIEVFSAEVNQVRLNPAQNMMAQWFEDTLLGCEYEPRRIQEALSFRTMAPAFGAAWNVWNNALQIWEDELNGSTDSPVVLGDGSMVSTSNFVSPELSLILESLSLAISQLSSAVNQRMQKLMNPQLSGLPKYLSPIGGPSAGFVPLQKTAASLMVDIQYAAQPVIINPPPVSESVEDFAPMTTHAAKKLAGQLVLFDRIIALEAIVACQAIDLRGPETSNDFIDELHNKIRTLIPFRKDDKAVDFSDEKLFSIAELLAR